MAIDLNFLLPTLGKIASGYLQGTYNRQQQDYARQQQADAIAREQEQFNYNRMRDKQMRADDMITLPDGRVVTKAQYLLIRDQEEKSRQAQDDAGVNNFLANYGKNPSAPFGTDLLPSKTPGPMGPTLQDMASEFDGLTPEEFLRQLGQSGLSGDAQKRIYDMVMPYLKLREQQMASGTHSGSSGSGKEPIPSLNQYFGGGTDATTNAAPPTSSPSYGLRGGMFNPSLGNGAVVPPSPAPTEREPYSVGLLRDAAGYFPNVPMDRINDVVNPAIILSKALKEREGVNPLNPFDLSRLGAVVTGEERNQVQDFLNKDMQQKVVWSPDKARLEKMGATITDSKTVPGLGTIYYGTANVMKNQALPVHVFDQANEPRETIDPNTGKTVYKTPAQIAVLEQKYKLGKDQREEQRAAAKFSMEMKKSVADLRNTNADTRKVLRDLSSKANDTPELKSVFDEMSDLLKKFTHPRSSNDTETKVTIPVGAPVWDSNNAERRYLYLKDKAAALMDATMPSKLAPAPSPAPAKKTVSGPTERQLQQLRADAAASATRNRIPARERQSYMNTYIADVKSQADWWK